MKLAIASHKRAKALFPTAKILLEALNTLMFLGGDRNREAPYLYP